MYLQAGTKITLDTINCKQPSAIQLQKMRIKLLGNSFFLYWFCMVKMVLMVLSDPINNPSY